MAHGRRGFAAYLGVELNRFAVESPDRARPIHNGKRCGCDSLVLPGVPTKDQGRSVGSSKLSLVERTIGVLCLMCLFVLVAHGLRVDLHNNPGFFIMGLFSFWIAHIWLLVVLVMSLIRKKRSGSGTS
jgi:hypothetical protein